MTAHSENCDGFRTTHRQRIEKVPSMWRVVCEECGPAHGGWFGIAVTWRDAQKLLTCHEGEIECDGQCLRADMGVG